jgi:hypothetical protein
VAVVQMVDQGHRCRRANRCVGECPRRGRRQPPRRDMCMIYTLENSDLMKGWHEDSHGNVIV